MSDPTLGVGRSLPAAMESVDCGVGQEEHEEASDLDLGDGYGTFELEIQIEASANNVPTHI